MLSLRIPPTISPTPKPFRQPLILPPYLDPSCVLCLLPLRDNKWYDFSGKSNHGAISGAIWTAEGTRGPALSFDGSDDYVDCGAGTSLNITGNITLEALVYLKGTGVSGYPRIVDKASDTSVTNGFSFFVVGISKEVQGYAAGGLRVESASKLTLNKWYHIVITADGTYWTIYLNGEWDKSALDSTLPNSTTTKLYISNASAATRPFQGLIPLVRVYNRALRALEVKAIYDLVR